MKSPCWLRRSKNLPLPTNARHISEVLISLSAQAGAGCVPALLTLLQNADLDNRKAALHALVAAGGSDAMAAVANSTGGADASLKDEAVRALCSWPDVWPEDASVAAPLLNVAKTDPDSSHQILASRAYLQFLLGDEKLGADDKLAKLQDIMPLLQRREEKITAIAVLQGIPASAALDRLTAFASDQPLADDACSAIVQAASQNKSSIPVSDRQKALQFVAQQSANSETKHKAEEALKALQ